MFLEECHKCKKWVKMMSQVQKMVVKMSNHEDFVKPLVAFVSSSPVLALHIFLLPPGPKIAQSTFLMLYFINSWRKT